MGGDGRYSLNYARIVYRLLTNPRGYAVDDLCEELGVGIRTYRNYRKALQERFEFFFDKQGESMLVEVDEGDRKYLRLLTPKEHFRADPDFAARVAALYFAKERLSFADETPIGDAVESMITDFKQRLRDPNFTINHTLRNVDRMFVDMPNKTTPYVGFADLISQILRGMLLNHSIELRYDSVARPELQRVTVDPLTLITHENELFLLAAVHRLDEPNIRTFSIDRIREYRLTTVRFEYPSSVKYDPYRYIERAWGVVTGPDDTEFELLFKNAEPWLKQYLENYVWHPSQTLEALPGGCLKLTFQTTDVADVNRWLEEFGDDVEVLAPK